MAAHSSAIPENVPFRTLPPLAGGTKVGLGLLVLVGIASFFLAPDGETHGRAWLALHHNWLFWTALSLGMVVLAVAFHLTNARWAWSVRRFALAGVAFLPISIVLFVVDFWGGKEYNFHHWTHFENDSVLEAKKAWLNVPGMFIRDFVGLLVLSAMAFAFARLALRPDVYGAGRDDHQRGWYRRLTANFRGVPEEAADSVRKMNFLGVAFALAYAFIVGMLAIDQAMSMLPHWFSTMFPVAFFVAGFHAGICAMVLGVTVFRKRLGLEEFVTVRQYHDMGKLVFAFAVFWMYLNWSQYVVIWYGLLPHEQQWFVQRFREPFSGLAAAVPLMIFVIPFFGLFTRPPKKVPAILAAFAVLILAGHWLERYMITVPSVYEGKTLPPLWLLPEIGIGLGFMALFILCYTWFLRTFPVLPSPASMRAMGQAEVQVAAPTGAVAPHA